MSYKSVNISFSAHLSDDINNYKVVIDALNKKLKDTDIFGFFYCCIDLLYLLNDENSGSGSYKIFTNLEITDFYYTSLLRLFNLYYLILPTDYKIDKIDIDYLSLNKMLPDIDTTRQSFDFYIDDNNINLYRYILYIYNFLVKARIGTIIEEKKLKNFLVGISVCLLPTFNYESFNFSDICKSLNI